MKTSRRLGVRDIHVSGRKPAWMTFPGESGTREHSAYHIGWMPMNGFG
jgi:hypothetical protein